MLLFIVLSLSVVSSYANNVAKQLMILQLLVISIILEKDLNKNSFIILYWHISFTALPKHKEKT